MTTHRSDRFLPADAPLETEIPADLRAALEAFLDGEAVPTLAAFGEGLRATFGERAIAETDLCTTDEPTPHRARTGDDEYTFACFYDAVILATLRQQRVSIRTASPDGTVIRARADGAGRLSVDPAGAIFSFGIDPTIANDDRPPRLERGYAAICPYVKAFPSFASYADWTGALDAPTVATPMTDATAFAALLVAP